MSSMRNIIMLLSRFIFNKSRSTKPRTGTVVKLLQLIQIELWVIIVFSFIISILVLHLMDPDKVLNRIAYFISLIERFL